MKIIKGDFSGKNKALTISKQKPEQQIQETILNKEIPYSAMLLDLIKPYVEPTPYPDDLQKMLQAGIVAWNMAVSKSIGVPRFKQMFDATIKTAEISETEVDIVKQIMKAKHQYYDEHRNFIEDYKLEEDEKGVIHVSVVSKSMFDFMNEIEMEDDDDIEALQYEEGFVNRNALLVKPKPAFWGWFKKSDNDFMAPELPVEHTIYLISEKDSDKETVKWLKKNFDKIFINELESWITVEKYWPTNRNYKMFCEFFDIEFHSMVMDMEKEPVIKD